jgi:hypothetical protein
MRQCVERRHADDPPAMNECQPLDRRDADPQPRERSRSRGDRIEIDRRQRPRVRPGQLQDLGGQAQRVRARAIAAPLVDDAIVCDERGASAPVASTSSASISRLSALRSSQRSTGCSGLRRKAEL